MPNFLTEEEQAYLDEPLGNEEEELDEEAEEEEDESETESEAEEQSETAEADAADEEEDEADEGDEKEFEIDGIKFKAVVAADGSHQIPMSVLQQLRQQNADLKSKQATAGTKADEPVEDEWKDLRGMTAVERAEYALESDEAAERVEKFVVVKHNEQQFEAEATEAVQGFIKTHEDLMADPVYYGAIQRTFDAGVAKGLSPKAAIAEAENAVNKRLGIGQAAEEPAKPGANGKQKPARVIRTLGGGPGSGANRDTSSPDLDSPDEEIVVKRYASLSDEERAHYRIHGTPR